jgi:hypothetical protein
VRLNNPCVVALLRSPLHRLLSGSTDVLRYTGRRSGRTITTPTQYARHGDDVVILVGRADNKSWWRNFRGDARSIEVLLGGRWVTMTARAVIGADEPEVAAPLLDAYLTRFPRAARPLGNGTREEQLRRAVLVWCRPR